MNLLYVALTRARCTLYLFTQGKGGTIGELLTNGVHQLFSTHIGHYDQDHSYYALGQLSDAFAQESDKAAAQTADKAPEKAILSLQERVSPPSQGNPFSTPPKPLQVAMETLKHEVEFRQSNRSADFLQGRDEAESAMRYIDRGLLLPAVSPENSFAFQANEQAAIVAAENPDLFVWACNIDPRMAYNSPKNDLGHFLRYYKDMGAKGMGELTPNIPADCELLENMFRA